MIVSKKHNASRKPVLRCYKQGWDQGKLLVEGAKISWGPGGRALWWGSGGETPEADAFLVFKPFQSMYFLV